MIPPLRKKRWRDQHERESQRLAPSAHGHDARHHHKRQPPNLDDISIGQFLHEPNGVIMNNKASDPRSSTPE